MEIDRRMRDDATQRLVGADIEAGPAEFDPVRQGRSGRGATVMGVGEDGASKSSGGALVSGTNLMYHVSRENARAIVKDRG